MTVSIEIPLKVQQDAAKWSLTDLYEEALQLASDINNAKEEGLFAKGIYNAKAQYLAIKVLRHAETMFFYRHDQEDVAVAMLARGVRLLLNDIEYSTYREQDFSAWKRSLSLLRNQAARGVQVITDYHDGSEEYAHTLESLEGMRVHLRAVADAFYLWSH